MTDTTAATGTGQDPGDRAHRPRRVYVLACQVLQSALQPLVENMPGLATCRFMPYGLHGVPAEMASRLQAVVNSETEPGVVLVGYGLCGNGLVGLQSGRHRLVIPRTDDCIAVLMGSYQRYREDFFDHPGTYYLSEGWLESGFHPVAQLAHWCARHGEDKARQLIARTYKRYRRVVLVALTSAEFDRYRAQAQEVAELLGAAYEEMLGAPTLLERLVWHADALDRSDDAFVVVPPGAQVRQRDFVR